MKQFRTLRPDEIECRVAQCNEKGASILLYKTARTDADILDETVGAQNWENDFKLVDGVLYGGIGIDYVGNGKLIWHSLGAKTIELVHENVSLETIRDDLETLVLDAEVIEGLLASQDPKKKSKEIEIKLIARLRKHAGNPVFVALGERLEKLKERHELGLLHSLDFFQTFYQEKV